ncbi:MAG: phenylacetate--CoA ligase family protein [Candidatus Binatia bacterium]
MLETLPRDQLEQLQLLKFKRAARHAYTSSPFYRKKLDSAKIKPGDIKTLSDIQKIPMTDKDELREAQQTNPFPYGDLLAVSTDDVTAYHQTSGTTGQPVRQADSWRDWEWWSECWATILWAQGFRPRDRVFIPFSYGVFIAFWVGHYACEKIGCEVIPGGGLSTEDRILKMKEIRATALMGTPTYGLHMAEVAGKMGINLANELDVTKMLCSGEPGALIPSTKRRLEERWGAKVYDHAGATEGGAWGFECAQQPGALHINEAMFLVEVLDTETGEPVAPGGSGELVITPLDRKAQPYLRFNLKDIALLSEKPCKCGRSFRLLKGGILGRCDRLTKIRGILFSPTSVEEVVRGFSELGDEYQVILQKRGELDEVTVKVEIKPDGEKSADLEERLRQELRLHTGLRVNVELEAYGTLPRFEVKASRFKDQR